MKELRVGDSFPQTDKEALAYLPQDDEQMRIASKNRFLLYRDMGLTITEAMMKVYQASLPEEEKRSVKTRCYTWAKKLVTQVKKHLEGVFHS